MTAGKETMVSEWQNSFYPRLGTTKQGQPTPPHYLSGEHTIGLATREGKLNHNTVVEKGRYGNATVNDRRTSIYPGQRPR